MQLRSHTKRIKLIESLRTKNTAGEQQDDNQEPDKQLANHSCWSHLPPELIYHSLTFLSPHTVTRLKRLCKAFSRYITSKLIATCFAAHLLEKCSPLQVLTGYTWYRWMWRGIPVQLKDAGFGIVLECLVAMPKVLTDKPARNKETEQGAGAEGGGQENHTHDEDEVDIPLLSILKFTIENKCFNTTTQLFTHTITAPLIQPLLNEDPDTHWDLIDEVAESGRLDLLTRFLEMDPPDMEESLPCTLSFAVEAGHADIVRKLLEIGGTEMVEEDHEEICSAASAGHLEIIKLLLEAGGSVNPTDGYSWYALRAAASRGNSEVVEYLLSHGAHVKPNALYESARHGHATIFHHLLSLLPKEDLPDLETYLPSLSHIDSTPSPLELLLSTGIGTKNTSILTRSLLTSIHASHINNIRLLIQYGANPCPPDNTPLLESIRYGDPDIVSLLLSHGADPNTPLHRKRTVWNGEWAKHCSSPYTPPLLLAIYHGQVKLLPVLLSAGADATFQNSYPLFAAASCTNCNHYTYTPTAVRGKHYIATTTDRVIMCEALIQAGAEVNSGKGRVLGAACDHKRVDRKLIKYLIEEGADVEDGRRYSEKARRVLTKGFLKKLGVEGDEVGVLQQKKGKGRGVGCNASVSTSPTRRVTTTRVTRSISGMSRRGKGRVGPKRNG